MSRWEPESPPRDVHDLCYHRFFRPDRCRSRRERSPEPVTHRNVCRKAPSARLRRRSRNRGMRATSPPSGVPADGGDGVGCGDPGSSCHDVLKRRRRMNAPLVTRHPIGRRLPAQCCPEFCGCGWPFVSVGLTVAGLKREAGRRFRVKPNASTATTGTTSASCSRAPKA